MRQLVILFILSSLSPTLFANDFVKLAIVHPEDFTVRRFNGRALIRTGEKLPKVFYVKIPRQFVKRGNDKIILIEPSLEAWRMGSRLEEGSPLVIPGGLGKCSYNFGGKQGCDMYPFENSEGDIRYFAMRFMARESEKTKLDESDYSTVVIPGLNGEPDVSETFYSRSGFIESTPDGRTIKTPKPVNLEKGVIPKPYIKGGQKGFLKSGLEGIKGYVDYTEADADQGVTCEGPQNPLQCMICNCHHETGITDEKDKLAVGKVVMTRLGMKSYNKGMKEGVCDMIYEHKSQFTWFFDGKPEEVVKGKSFRTCLPLMKKALAFRGHFASHYHARWMKDSQVSWLRIPKGKNKGKPNCRGKTYLRGSKTLGHKFYEICDPGRRRADPALQRRALGVSQ